MKSSREDQKANIYQMIIIIMFNKETFIWQWV